MRPNVRVLEEFSIPAARGIKGAAGAAGGHAAAMAVVAWCARCRRPAPVDAEQLVGPFGGDPTLLPIIPPPQGWLGDPDGDGLMCGDCATPEEITDWMAGAR